MWPEGMQCAAAFTFDFDAESVWIADHPANADKPGVLSQGRYAPRVAIPLILQLLENMGVKATFFIIGTVAEQYPDSIQSIANHGHELAVHGYTHQSPAAQQPEEEEDSIVRTREILRTYQEQVVGYRSPSWDFSQNTLRLLSKHRFRYSSNMMDDLRPYLHPEIGVIELPIHWLLDDAAHFWFDLESWDKKISTPSEVLEIWEAEFEGIYQLGGSFILTMHPQIIGRPYRLRMLESFISFVQFHAGVWLTTCKEIAEQAGKTLHNTSVL